MIEKGMIVLRCNDAYKELVNYRKMRNMEPRVIKIEDEQRYSTEGIDPASLLWQPIEFGPNDANGSLNQSFGKANSRLR